MSIPVANVTRSSPEFPQKFSSKWILSNEGSICRLEQESVLFPNVVFPSSCFISAAGYLRSAESVPLRLQIE
ncbi:hypothetical protein ANCCEY_15668 [Ancylostoma ceylanicum]|uniref:Uncharacterized protein n=1 Tax=Ancylostoma ceylanicum TaxID=53326 RepID=A0A0D6L3M4_9BILA|nr:hypothetical protein ANCCEY_15668 [Ancylostoma ceylanicum]